MDSISKFFIQNTRLISFVIILFISQASTQVFIFFRVQKIKDISLFINMAGRQRMLSQRIYNYALLLKLENKPNASLDNLHKLDIESLIDQFKTADILLRENTFYNDSLVIQFASIKPHFDLLIQSVERLRAIQNPDEIVLIMQVLDKEQLRFLMVMERIVISYERVTSNRLEDFILLEIVLSLASFFVSLITLTSVVTPLIGRIRKKNLELVESNYKLASSAEEISSSLEQILQLNQHIEQAWDRDKLFISQAPGAIAMFDREMRYLAVSDKWYEDYALHGKEITGKSHYDIFPEIGDDWKKIHRECLNGEINVCAEALFEREDGTKQWLTWDVRPWKNTNGTIGGIIMYTADITKFKKLGEAQARMQTIIDEMSEVARIGAWELDLKKGQLSWSKMSKLILEVPEDFQPELEGGFNFYKEGESREKAQKAIGEAIEIGKNFDIEVELVTAKNKNIWVRTIGKVETTDGKPVAIYGLSQDIDKAKKREFQIQKTFDELNAIIASSTEVSIVVTDLSGVITHFNSGAEHLLGYKANEVIAKETALLIHDEKEVIERGTELTNEYGRKIEGYEVLSLSAKVGQPESREWDYKHKDGSSLKVIVSVTALKNNQQEIFGFLCVATNISERKAFEEKLIESEKRMNEAQSIAKVGSWELNLQTFDLSWSREQYRIFELQDTPADKLLDVYSSKIHPDDVIDLRSAVNRAIEKGVAFEYEQRILFKGGRIKYLLGVGKPILDANGKPVAIHGTGQDITQRKNAEAELKIANQELLLHEQRGMINNQLLIAKEKAEENDRLKSAFLANMSHEIRTPLNAIMGFNELLTKNSYNQEEKNRFHEHIDSAGHRLLRLIADILDISKIEANQISLVSKATPVNKLMDQLHAQFQTTIGDSEVTLSLVKGLSDDESLLLTDGQRLSQILSNLLENAKKFTYKGAIEFGYTRHNAMLEFYVKDSGIGIDAKNHQLIFERFGQAEKCNAILYDGTGLGLSIVEGLVRLLGGEIWVQSEINRGAIFYFTIPYKQVAKTNAKTNTHIQPNTNQLEGIKVLLVEDNLLNHLHLASLLKGFKCEVLSGYNGKEAIDLVSINQDINIVLLDINMPIMNGYEAMKAIKKINSNIPVIAQTGNATSDDLEKIEKTGFNDHIIKPISNTQLAKVLLKHLNKI